MVPELAPAPDQEQTTSHLLEDIENFEWHDIDALNSIGEINEATKKVKAESKRYSEWFEQAIDNYNNGKINEKTYQKLSKQYDNIGLNIASALEILEKKKGEFIL